MKKPSTNQAIRAEILQKCKERGLPYKTARKLMKLTFREYRQAWLKHYGVMQ